jgi:hypothetical protein
MLYKQKTKIFIYWKFIIMSDITYEYISQLKVPQLEDYLRNHVLTTSGRKMVALAHGTIQLGFETKASATGGS